MIVLRVEVYIDIDHPRRIEERKFVLVGVDKLFDCIVCNMIPVIADRLPILLQILVDCYCTVCIWESNQFRIGVHVSVDSTSAVVDACDRVFDLICIYWMYWAGHKKKKPNPHQRL